MATCLIVDNANESRDQFERVMEHLAESGPIPPSGASVLIAGAADGGWRVISVWDSPESLQRFYGDRLAPAYENAGLSLEGMRRSTFEVHTAVVQPAEARPA